MRKRGAWTAAWLAGVAAVLIGVIGLTGCADGGGDRSEKLSIRGSVKSVSDLSGAQGKLLAVEGMVEPDTEHDKASVKADRRTAVYRIGQDGKKSKASLDDLKAGIQVEIRFDGPVALSYPVQAKAGEIVIIN